MPGRRLRKAPDKAAVAEFLNHRYLVAPAVIDEFQQPDKIVLRAPAVIVIAQHFERHHTAHRHPGGLQDGSVHVAAHLGNAEK